MNSETSEPADWGDKPPSGSSPDENAPDQSGTRTDLGANVSWLPESNDVNKDKEDFSELLELIRAKSLKSLGAEGASAAENPENPSEDPDSTFLSFMNANLKKLKAQIKNYNAEKERILRDLEQDDSIIRGAELLYAGGEEAGDNGSSGDREDISNTWEKDADYWK